MKLNKTTEKAKRWIDCYFKSTCSSVLDFYTRPSYRKINIEASIRDKISNNGFHGYRILGGNSSFFTCGYLNSNNSMLYIETACKTFEIEL